MKIYTAHSSSFDYINEFYNPIKNSGLINEHTFIFPHEKPEVFVNSKNIIKNCDLVIAEVSYHSTGLGIELGWADIFNTPMLLVYKQGCTPTKALQVLNSKMVSYKNTNYLVKIVNDYFSEL